MKYQIQSIYQQGEIDPIGILKDISLNLNEQITLLNYYHIGNIYPKCLTSREHDEVIISLTQKGYLKVWKEIVFPSDEK